MEKSLLPLVKPAAPAKSSSSIPGTEDLEELLRVHFGHSHFRGKQLEAIQAVLSGRDCFCLMPTGGGKSMCYQIPAFAKPGIVLVVSPLIALMENQVTVLKEKGVEAEYLSSTQTAQVREKIYGELEHGKPSLRLLYVTPELIATFGFKSKLRKLHMRSLLSLIAIDEAHCVSTWGHDFRPTYRQLSSIRDDLPGVPMLALTATAAPKVQKDVIGSLGLHNPVVLKASFNRPNIFYEVRYKDAIDDTYADLSNLIKSNGSMCSIIYCLERSTCDDLSSHLRRNGIPCAAYHAGLNNKVRSTVLDDWLASRIQVVVATVAFGMGIDRKDVRFVCHYNIPKSMEAFYQESGRAGRDHLPSKSLLYYGLDDCRRMEFILKNAGTKKQKLSTSSDALVEKTLENFTRMVEYCEGTGCRRKKILESFGEKVSESLCQKTCDSCKNPGVVFESIQKLHHASSNHRKYGLVPVFITSSMDSRAAHQESEFWNQEDEENISNDDISVSDDEVEIVNCHIKTKMPAKAKPMERIELLQRAEEMYYAGKIPKKQTGAISDKKAVSETLRDAAKQRLQNALKQAKERLDSVMVEFETAAVLLEAECYRKYAKVGKTFYNSQVASTVRWLASASLEEIDARLSTSHSPDIVGIRPDSGVAHASKTLPIPSTDSAQAGARFENKHTTFQSAARLMSTQLRSQSEEREELPLPPIPSFCEFVSQKQKACKSKHLPTSSQGPAQLPKRPTGLDRYFSTGSEKRTKKQ